MEAAWRATVYEVTKGRTRLSDDTAAAEPRDSSGPGVLTRATGGRWGRVGKHRWRILLLEVSCPSTGDRACHTAGPTQLQGGDRRGETSARGMAVSLDGRLPAHH